jgi:diguanylate cyclase (GGDEF)-like protein
VSSRDTWMWAALVLALMAFVVAFALDAPALWRGTWLTLTAFLSAVALGPIAGVLVILASSLVIWALPGSSIAFALDELGAQILVAAFAASLGGSWVHRATDQHVRSTLDDGRRARLLVEAAMELGRAHSEGDVLAALPPLASRVMAFDHASVLRVRPDGLVLVAIIPALLPPGHRVAEASVVGRAARSGVTQYVEDVRREPDYVAVPGIPGTASDLAVPLHVGDRVEAVLNVERRAPRAFDDADRRALEALAHIAEAHLERLATLRSVERQRHEADVLASVAHQLTQIEDVHRAATTALDVLVAELDLEGGVVLAVERGRFHALAATRGLLERVPDLAEGVPWGRSRIDEAWRSERPTYVDDASAEETEGPLRTLGWRAFARVPVRDLDGGTVALVFVGAPGRATVWSDDERRLVETIASSLGAALARATQRQRESELLEVVRTMAQSDDSRELYQRAVDASVRLVPGAEAASLLVRDDDGAYAFQAVVGYDLAALQRVGRMTEAEQLVWYGDGADAYRAGRPRLRTGDAVADASAAGADSDTARAVLVDAGRTARIRANVCTPITYGGDAVGVLNVDAFTHEGAFGPRSLALAEALGQHVAVIVRQAHDRAALARSALVDPLTGLGNREAFNQRVEHELARTERYDQPLALAMLDLDGFKAVNDRYGHHAGDRALALVANALQGASRASDTVYRWGGDEFAVVMPMLGPVDARNTAARLAAAVATIDLADVRLGASVGIATYPEDGRDAGSLMRRADDLMYASKGGRA